MEMQDSAVNHMMSLQTNILEELRESRRQEELRSRQTSTATQVAQMSAYDQPPSMTMEPIATQSPQYQIDMYNAAQHYGNSGINQSAVISPVNPTAYQSLGATVGGLGQTAKETIGGAITYDPTRMSKEATAEMFANRSHAFQTGTVKAAGDTVSTIGGIGGFFAGGGLVGGLAAASVVGGATAIVAGSMTQGAQESLRYQDILRRDGYKAFNALESTTEYGGLGMKLDDQQNISKELRQMATENFLDDQDMSTILQGSLDNKLLKSVTDVKSFKDKFSNIVDSVKEISLTLNQTIEEAVEFMGEMERRGVGSDKMSKVAATGKVASSFLGVDANEYMQQMMMQTDSIVSGTSMDTEQVMGNIGYNSYLLTAVEDTSRDGDGVNRQFIKNKGGAAAFAGEVEGNIKSYFNGAGKEMLGAMFSSAFVMNDEGNFSLDEGELNRLLGSGKGHRELLEESEQYRRTLSDTDQLKLVRSAGELFNQSASPAASMQVMRHIQEQFAENLGPNMDPESALIQAGVVNDDMTARVLNEMLIAGTSEDSLNQFAALSIKEQTDSARLADSPSIWQRTKRWGKETFTQPLGNVGQSISDSVGDVGQSLQMTMSGIEKTGKLGGEMLGDLSEEALMEQYYGSESNFAQVQRLLDERMQKNAGEANGSDKLFIEEKDFKAMAQQIKMGTMDEKSVKDMEENLRDGLYSVGATKQAEYLTNSYRGAYESASGIQQGTRDYAAALSGIEDVEAETYENKGDRGQRVSSKSLERMIRQAENGDLSASEIGKIRQNMDDSVYSKGSKEAMEYVLALSTGKYDGMSELFKKSDANTAARAAVLDEEKALKKDGKDTSDFQSLEEIKKKEKELKEGMTGELKKFNALIADTSKDIGVDAKQFGELELLVTAGDTEGVKKLTQNEEVASIAEKYRKYNKERSNLNNAQDLYSDGFRTTQGVLKMSEGIYDFLEASGAVTKDEADYMFSGEEKTWKKELGKVQKKAKKGKLSDEQLADTTIEYTRRGRDIMAGLSDERLAASAQFLVENTNGSVTMDDLLQDDSNVVDANKLYDHYMKYSKVAESGDSAAEGAIVDSKEAVNASEEHTKAMNSFVDAFKSETGKMYEAIEDIKSKDYTNKTSVHN